MSDRPPRALPACERGEQGRARRQGAGPLLRGNSIENLLVSHDAGSTCRAIPVLSANPCRDLPDT
jgi:hypothetical protein